MTDPISTITTGSTGAQLVTAFDLNATALADLQAAVSLLATQVLSLPAGAYVAPGAGQYQTYGANATPWATASSQGKANLINAPYSTNVAWADYWAAGVCAAVTLDASATLTFRRIAITAGVPSVVASVALPFTTNMSNGMSGNGWSVVYALPVSANIYKVVYGCYANYGNPFEGFYEALVTWDGVSALSVASTLTSYTSQNSSVPPQGYGSKRAFLCGASSALAVVVSNGLYGANTSLLIGQSQGTHLITRANDQSYWNQSPDTNIAWLGGGYSVSATAFGVPADNVNRLVFRLRLTDDQQTLTLAQVRMTGYTFATWIGVWALSNTLVLAQFKDAGGQQYTVLLSVATGATPSMGMLAISTVGYLGSVAFSPLQPLCWNSAGNDAYLYGGMTGTSMYFYHITYNPSTGALTCTTRITVPLGGASAGAQTTAIAGLTAAAPYAWWQSGTDQITVLYYATATASGWWIETFNLA